ncbi:MAG: ECF transporter S component [Firmicutes bacterium]|nr:ECF transporter S component [Bacillota bacterium]
MDLTSDKSRTLGLVQTALLGAIIFLLAFTPSLGYIPLGVINATIIHVPVIIGSLILGPKRGAVLGFLFGLTSMIMATTSPALTSFIFSPFLSSGVTPLGPLWSLIICFIPRILVGIVPWYVYQALKGLFKGKKGTDSIALFVSGVAGSMTNTILVMGLIYILFGHAYAEAVGISYSALFAAIMSVIAVNGVLEAIVAGILSGAIVKALRLVFKGGN